MVLFFLLFFWVFSVFFGVFLGCSGDVLGRSGLFYDMLSVLACSGVFWRVLACFWCILVWFRVVIWYVVCTGGGWRVLACDAVSWVSFLSVCETHLDLFTIRSVYTRVLHLPLH